MNRQVAIIGSGNYRQRASRVARMLLLSSAVFATLKPGHAPAGDDLTACGENSGPDLILSDIQGVANYTPSDGIDAFSFGNTHCNLGDAPAAYMASTNAHPVIGFNMYRLRDGRFEQIGMSWLLHGFFALSGNACGCTCAPTNGSLQGVGCSSSDTAGIQGSAPGLGPRFDVNSYTGFFPYPPSPGDSGSQGTGIYKRLQVALTDLDPQFNEGASYVLEGFIHSADDAHANNAFNNASHRPIQINYLNGNATAVIIGVTAREQPAIRAWAALDPEVLITSVPVPEDGILLLGAKAAYAGDGYWTYEYALYNHNMHRSVQGFNVPIPPGVAIVNVGFHDVNYHSGEPFDGTDWPSSLINQSLRWQTEPFDQNPNANALRWGTLYNYRFRATRGPATGFVTLDIFRPGTPASIAVSTLVPSDVSPDCNDNGIDDVCDVTCLFDGGPCAMPRCGGSADSNLDGAPDECAAIGDVNADGYVDLADFADWDGCALGPDVAYPFAHCEAFDVNGDGDVDLRDLRGLMNSFRPADP